MPTLPNSPKKPSDSNPNSPNMPKSAFQYYREGAQLLHKNLYVFWINLAYMIPIAHILPTNQQLPTLIMILIPFMMITLRLVDTQLLYTLPQKTQKIAATYAITVYRYFFRVVGLLFLAGLLGMTIFAFNSGNIASLAAQLETATSNDATLWQRLSIYLPMIILAPMIPFFKIYWIVKRQSFFRSIFSGIKYAVTHVSFTLSLTLIELCVIIFEHPINQYFHKPSLFIFTIINGYIGLVLTSASIIYFKSHKDER